LEKLHGEVEKQLELFLKNQKTGAEWRKFRETLIGLTDVTHSHFAKLVQVSLTLSTVGGIFFDKQLAGHWYTHRFVHCCLAPNL
jgi:hypothetical protein